MNNNHRYFIQFMLDNGSVTVERALEFGATLNPEYRSLQRLKVLISEINAEIEKQLFKIVERHCEVTEKDYILWINLKSDHISKIQSGFYKIQLEYFHTVLQEILASQNYRLRRMVALNLRTSLTEKYSLDNAEKALKLWCKQNYYVEKDEHIYIGPKLIVEFQTYLQVHSNNCTCELCSELVFIGQTCDSCNKNFHKHCLQRYLENHASCPHCNNAWEEAEYALTQHPNIEREAACSSNSQNY